MSLIKAFRNSGFPPVLSDYSSMVAANRGSRRDYASIVIAICNHPSEKAANFERSSRSAFRGTAAPCKTGSAKSTLRLLGNRDGKRELSADPTVCCCPCLSISNSLSKIACGKNVRDPSRGVIRD